MHLSCAESHPLTTAYTSVQSYHLFVYSPPYPLGDFCTGLHAAPFLLSLPPVDPPFLPAGFRVSGKGDGIVCALHSPHFSSPGSSFSTCVCVCPTTSPPPFLLPPPPPDMSHTCKVLTAAPSSTSSVPGTYIQSLL